MSKNYVKAVLDHLQSVTSPIDALVLLAIAEYTSDENRQAWPSIRALVRRTRLDERTVRRTLRRLEASRLLSTTIGGQIEDKNGHLINTSSCYRLEFDHQGQPLQWKAPPKRALKGVDSPPPAPPASTPRPQNVTPSPRPAVKRIPTAEPARDLSAEKQRQLAAILKKISS